MATARADRQEERSLSYEEAFALLRREPDNWAVFLDIDGCLLDLAPTPDEIFVPPDLPGNIERLRLKLGGALALVTGRGLVYADALFDPFPFPIAGLHGADVMPVRVLTTKDMAKAALLSTAMFCTQGTAWADAGAAEPAVSRPTAPAAATMPDATLRT